jgi:hypothetical protein
MIYRISGGIFLILAGLDYCGLLNAGGIIIGIFGIVAGIALLAGV